MGFFQNMYDKNKYVRTAAQKIGFTRPLNLDTSSPRIVEYPWTLNNFPLAHNKKVLDIGSCGSQLPVNLVCLGLDVWTLDVRKYEYAALSDHLHVIVGDIEKTEFEDNFFDAVSAISTLEHIGLGRYGDKIDNHGDKKAVSEIKRIISSKGLVLVTVPFGRSHTSKLHRVYDKERLMSLVEEFKIQKVEYFSNTGKLWKSTDEEQVKKVDSSLKEKAVACLKLVKP